jgi:exodeoxyribonuclease V beta subunit
MSKPIRVAHWRELPLEGEGRALVEASAGTGKTWTIGVLYLRLLLESAPRRGVEQVVVTTFTEAAAQELRERLRRRLADALRQLDDGAPAGEPAEDAAWLAARWVDGERRAEDRRRLQLALADFDRAPVGTLHRLCRRILAEHPLEGGTGFEPGEPTADQALMDELARDAWRVLQQGEDTAALAHAGLDEIKLTTFGKTLSKMMRPGVRIEADGEDLAAIRADCPPGFAAGLDALLSEKGWFQSRKTALANALRALAAYLEDETAELKDSAIKNLREFDLDGQLLPERVEAFAAHPLVQAARAFFARVEAARHLPTLRFWRDVVAMAARWRDERLAARGQTTFDEMIRQAHEALLARPALADALFADWPVALVDEFQDTDAQQYGILDRLYRDADGRPRGRLVMIGDPKQAIYAFRGGDIHAYRRASLDATHVLSLDTNHRSSRALVAAMNALYAGAGTALGRGVNADIHYSPVQASARQDATPLLQHGEPVARPLVLHHLADDPGTQAARRRRALDACADHVAQLLADGGHAIGTKPLQPGDIAVLLPRNDDIVALRHRLQARGVPCVGGARDSVFAGDWAFELEVVLHGLLAEDDEAALRAALLTRLWGGSLAALEALDADPAAWDAIAARRRRLRELWQRRGVLAVVQRLASEAAGRLLAHAAGERDLTDLRHLGELLQRQAERSAGPRELLAWLADQRAGDDEDADAADERQLRIESDARRVQLMTLHRSKGLEFNVVLLPLMWAQETTQVHKPYLVPQDGVPGKVVAFDPAARERLAWDTQDERFRLLYVALTRAVHACHVYTLPPDRVPSIDAKTPKPPPDDPQRAPLDAMMAALLGLPRERLPEVEWRDGWPHGATARASAAPAAEGRRTALAPPPPARLRQRLSFSSLVGGVRRATEEAPADDEAELPALEPAAAAVEPPHPALLALAGARGTAFGNALHAAFELREHGRPVAAQSALVLEQLEAFGVDSAMPLPELADALVARMDAALAAELWPGLSLGAVPPAAQRAEMAFHFTLDDARASALRAACAAHGEPGLVPAMSLERLRGLMTGKIDLVFEHAGRFHVLDYKGNWLGERVADYTGEALRAAMDHSHYRLQALLYSVAVHRLLAQRVPGYSPAAQLGEYVYLFVRGAGLGPEAGIFRERFDDALLYAVDAVFAASGEAA